MLDLKRLSHAATLAEYRNFARAAEALNISQPALTRSIQSMEEALGVRLFDRYPRDVVPTPFGRVLLERGSDLLGAAKDLMRELDLMKGVDTGELHLGSGLMSAAMAGPLLGEFTKRHPNIRIMTEIGTAHELFEGLFSSKLDLFIGDTSEYEHHEDIAVIPLKKRAGHYYCRSGHPLLEKRDIKLADVLEYPLAMQQVPQRIYEFWAADDSVEMSAEQLQLHQPMISCRDTSMLKAVVMNSNAVSVAGMPELQRHIDDGTLQILPIIGQAPLIEMKIAYLRNRTLSPPAAHFIELVKEFDAVADNEGI